jgi:DNA-binding transcriptional MerR regulator
LQEAHLSSLVFERRFNIREAAQRLGVHPHTIRKAEFEHRIPPIRRESVSGYRIFSEADIESLREYLKRND